ncbi:MAG: hypothetical protein WBB28_17405 [Crinalium sp.]
MRKNPQFFFAVTNYSFYYWLTINLIMGLMLPGKSLACACCAEVGQWYERSSSINNYELSQIQSLKFSPEAQLYLTVPGFDVIKGLSSNSQKYTVSQSKNQRLWNLKFKDELGKTGNLTFKIPTKATFFATDAATRSPRDSNNEPILYKEMRMEGQVSGNGIFAKGMGNDTKFRLVVQGKGNQCLNTEDFATWNLQIFGSRASYSFYGKF